MDILRDASWQRSGMTILWDGGSLGNLVQVKDVVSMRQLVQFSQAWPEDLPANSGNTLVVAGLDACLDLLDPADAEEWLARPLRQWILSFQEHYQLQAGLVFYVPDGHTRLRQETTGGFSWKCGPPHTSTEIDFGRALWSGAEEDVSWLGKPAVGGGPAVGHDTIGLFLRRLS